MDYRRFDTLTTFLATSPSRRHLLRALGGLAVGGFAPLAVPRVSDAFICREGGVLCAKDDHCCSGTCADNHCTCADPNLLVCHGRCACDAANCERCVHGECSICGGDLGQVCCDGTCIPAGGCCYDWQCAYLGGPCLVGVCENHECDIQVQFGGDCGGHPYG